MRIYLWSAGSNIQSSFTFSRQHTFHALRGSMIIEVFKTRQFLKRLKRYLLRNLEGV